MSHFHCGWRASSAAWRTRTACTIAVAAGQLAEARSSTGRRVTDVLVRGKRRLLLGHELLVSDGAREAEIDRCGRRGPFCPVTRKRPCGKLHVYLLAARGLNLDVLVVGAASGAYRSPMETDSRGRPLYYWMTAEDMERYLNDRAGLKPVTNIELDPEPGTVVTMTPRES